eukprot:scaffold108231_cov28-Tisochrysis_lutea.AAC.2
MMTAMRLTVFATACVTGCTEDSAKKAHLFETRSEAGQKSSLGQSARAGSNSSATTSSASSRVRRAQQQESLDEGGGADRFQGCARARYNFRSLHKGRDRNAHCEGHRRKDLQCGARSRTYALARLAALDRGRVSSYDLPKRTLGDGERPSPTNRGARVAGRAWNAKIAGPRTHPVKVFDSAHGECDIRQQPGDERDEGEGYLGGSSQAHAKDDRDEREVDWERESLAEKDG